MECKYGNCFDTTHHLYWPKKNYRSGVAKQFRELACNKETLCRCDHDELHRTTRPPERPTQIEMIYTIQQEGEAQ